MTVRKIVCLKQIIDVLKVIIQGLVSVTFWGGKKNQKLIH